MKTIKVCLKCEGKLMYTYDKQYGILVVPIYCQKCNLAYYGSFQNSDEEAYEYMDYTWPPDNTAEERREFWCYRFLGISAFGCDAVAKDLEDMDEMGNSYEDIPFLEPDGEVYYFDLALMPCGHPECYAGGSISFWENERGKMIKRQY